MWLFTTISVGPTTAYVLHAAMICTRCCHVRPRVAPVLGDDRLQRSVVVARHLFVVPSDMATVRVLAGGGGVALPVGQFFLASRSL